jgi:hypothetical protein
VTPDAYSDGMNLKRLAWLALLAFAVFFVVQSPAEAARVVKMTGETLGEWLGATADSLVKFIKSLA